MTGRRDQQLRDRATSGGLTGGAVVSVLLAAGSGERWPVLVAVGMVIGAVTVHRRCVRDQPYGYWAAWAAGAVVSLFLLWAQPGDASRLVLLPWAAMCALVAAVLFVRWRSHRDGHAGWGRTAQDVDN